MELAHTLILCVLKTTTTAICTENPCLNGGFCVLRTDSQLGYECDCRGSFTGVNCQVDEDPPVVRCPHDFNVTAPCNASEAMSVTWNEPTATDTSEQVTLIYQSHHSGDLLPVRQITEVRYTFDDAAGNRGQCTFMITVDCDNCLYNPCLNGRCLDQFLGYTCRCDRGWTGPRCGEDIDECERRQDVCGPNAICEDNDEVPGEYTCTCADGYTGTFCTEDIDECASYPCMNGSTCYNQINGFICFCPNGRHGINCEYELVLCDSDSECSNGGICYQRPPDVCMCFTDTSDDDDMEGCIIPESCDINELLETLAETTVTETNIERVAIALANATSNHSAIDRTGLTAVSTVLENIVAQRTPSTEVTENTIQTVDNILNVPNEEFEGSLASANILRDFETQLTLVQENLTMTERNVAVEVVQPPTRNDLAYATIPLSGTVDASLQNNEGNVYFDRQDVPRDIAEASVSLPGEAFDNISEKDPPVVFTVYLTPRLFQSSGANILPDGSQLLVNSRIISANIGRLGEMVQNLMSPVITSFLPTNDTLTNEPTCVFWDELASNWSTSGCTQSVMNTGTGAVICNCDHLTSFAILVSYHGDIKDFALDIVSTVGCALSIAALTLTVVSRFMVRELYNTPANKSLISLCVSLVALYAFFLAGIGQTHSPVLCVVMAALIHYFFLTSVCWSSAEAMNLFYLLVVTRRYLLTGYLVKVMLFCWGVPAIIVVFTFLVPYLAQGTSTFDHEYCFLPPGFALYIGVLLPVGAFVLFNSFIFILVARRLICQRVESSVTRRETRVDAALRHARSMLPVSLLLGATWIVGFFAVDQATRAFQWIFTILNALLGFLIFLLFTLMKKKGREGLQKLFCIQRIRALTSSHSTY